MSPRRPEQNEEIRAERRKQILETAIPLFARQGFDATSVSQIAREAGVSHGTIFLYFPTKEELFTAAVVEPLLDAEVHYRSILQGEGSPLDRIERLIREQVTIFALGESKVRLIHSVLGQRDRFAHLLPEIYAYTDRYARTLSPLIVEGQRAGELGPGDPRAIAFAYFAYLNGVTLISDPPGSAYFQETLETFIAYGLRLFAPLKEDHPHGHRLPG
ncbi:MAG: TetR/AcrR family transcriptional regulator [Bacillota bacterium]